LKRNPSLCNPIDFNITFDVHFSTGGSTFFIGFGSRIGMPPELPVTIHKFFKPLLVFKDACF